jgi:hypothetical protein
MAGWTPQLRLDETTVGCRLSLVGVAYGNGATLQDAANDLIARVLSLVMAMRSSGLRYSSELGPPDPKLLEYLWELGEQAVRGNDIRERVFGSTDGPPDVA